MKTGFVGSEQLNRIAAWLLSTWPLPLAKCLPPWLSCSCLLTSPVKGWELVPSFGGSFDRRLKVRLGKLCEKYWKIMCICIHDMVWLDYSYYTTFRIQHATDNTRTFLALHLYLESRMQILWEPSVLQNVREFRLSIPYNSAEVYSLRQMHKPPKKHGTFHRQKLTPDDTKCALPIYIHKISSSFKTSWLTQEWASSHQPPQSPWAQNGMWSRCLLPSATTTWHWSTRKRPWSCQKYHLEVVCHITENDSTRKGSSGASFTCSQDCTNTVTFSPTGKHTSALQLHPVAACSRNVRDLLMKVALSNCASW